MKEELEKKVKEFLDTTIDDIKLIDDLKVKYLGKKGILNDFATKMKDLSVEEKKEFGRVLNESKKKISDVLDEKKNAFETELLNKKLESESIDVTLPSTKIPVGAPSIIEKVIEELESIYISLGFDVVEGPEVEKDEYNFEKLNLPADHPARDEQDSFYIEGSSWLLRTHTSPVQVRTMIKNENKDYIRIVCPGKVYRRDTDDAQHSHNFTQMEGLLVGKDVSLAHLKSTLDMMSEKMFGSVNSRFRPSGYPFTEPSVEYDIECFKCHGKGCELCKNIGWITIGGAGMIHPNVLKNCDYDTDVWNGYAFGFGIERIAMIKYGINDVRVFYTNDLRELKEFNKREVI